MKNTICVKMILGALITISIHTVLPAQLVGSEVFIQTTYVEVGVSQCGSYGTVSAPPPGYHANAALPGLGYVVDYTQDGWAVAPPTGYNYCGDYFVPGSPVEGWAITFDGVDYINSNNGAMCDPYGVPMVSNSYHPGATEDTAIWVGEIAGMRVTQHTIVPHDSLFFITRVKLENIGATTITGIYYARNVDPDNEQPWSGNFTTVNTIERQPSAGSPDALVSAMGMMGQCYLGYGSNDSTASVNHGGFFSVPADDLYLGVGRTTTLGSVSTADIAIALAFSKDSLVPGAWKSFAVGHVLDSSDLSSAMLRTAPESGGDSVGTAIAGPTEPTGVWASATEEGMVSIALPEGMDLENVTLEVYDISGKIVLNQRITSRNASYAIPGAEPGIYFARITDMESGKSWSRKMFVK